MKYVRGFLMAWGMFCWIPCPYIEWRAEDRKAQIAMLPLIGTGMGAIVLLAWKLLDMIGSGPFVTGVVLTGLYFLLTGFIHLDGFMDCSDAIMPRHPQMEERRRILKDSHSGAFAVICVTLMFIMFAGSMSQLALEGFSLPAGCTMVVLFTASRFMSSLNVLLCEPMDISQYAMVNEGRPIGSVRDTIPAFIVLLLVTAATGWGVMTEVTERSALVYVITILAVVVTAGLTSRNDRKKLGGMNGDISGHMITMSEMVGVIVLAIGA